MDVGYYISELLGQHGDVNVPGLGYFAHTRVNGYYNDREGKFYPPGYSVQFDPQFLDDDDTLAVHIAEKKKISLASSKYFTEKFVMSLKQQAALAETALADLGWFSMNDLQVVFRPNNGTSTDPEFYGFPTIRLNKIGREPVAPEYEPQAETYTPQPADEEYNPIPYQVEESEEQYLIDMARSKRRTNIWVFIILTLIAVTIAVLLLQRYDPKAFHFNFGNKKEAPAVAPKIVVIEDTNKANADTDSIPKPIRNVAADSLTTGSSASADTLSIPRYELIINESFKNNAAAARAIIEFKKENVDAKVVPELPGKRVKVSVGTFRTRGLAEDRMKELLAAKKIHIGAYIEFINPKDNKPAMGPAKK